MSRDLTHVEAEYLNLGERRDDLNKILKDLRVAAQDGSTPEARADYAQQAADVEREVEELEARMQELRPQFSIDQKKRHAFDLKRQPKHDRDMENG